MAWRLGVDIGGTFTDFVLQNEQTGELVIDKQLTTPKDPSEAVLDGLYRLLEQQGIGLADVRQIIHGTTVASNVVLERKGIGVGLITTRGFKDVLQIGRQKKHDMYDLRQRKATPLLSQRFIFEVTERMQYDGSVLIPLNEDEVRQSTRQMVKLGIRSVAVCFLHSYKNPEHEKKAGAIIKEEAPEMLISLSSEVHPVWREYERTSTVVANAYVMTVAKDYLERLEAMLRGEGYAGNFYIIQSNGGLASLDTIIPYPVRMLESGPAAGALVAQYYGKLIGEDNLFSFDMGGTTAKSAVIDRGKPAMRSEIEVDRLGLKPASGITVAIPAIDLIEIGAGGGSIAKVEMGTIVVGPESTGADPGPICYQRGGTEPTVTDADVVLGYVNPDYFAGGSIQLDRDAAIKGIIDKIAKPLGIDVTEAAWGIHQMVNLNMEFAARAVSIEKGYDPRLYTFVAIGGAGPVHGIRLAKELGCRRILFPAAAGVASAIGLLVADVKFDIARSALLPLEQASVERMNSIFEDLDAEGTRLLRDTKVVGEFHIVRLADMRYVGQGYELTTPIPRKKLKAEDTPGIKQAFDRVYALNFGYNAPETPVEGVTWWVSASCPAPRVELKRAKKGKVSTEEALKEKRKVYFPEYKDYIDCNIYDHYRLLPGTIITGPAIVEERESTTVITPGDVAEIDEWGNLLVTLKD